MLSAVGGSAMQDLRKLNCLTPRPSHCRRQASGLTLK